MKRWPLLLLPVALVALSFVSPRTVHTQQQEAAPKPSPELERRLRDLEFPELRQRDPREIAVLEERVKIAESTFERIIALKQAGVSGGEADKVTQAEFALLKAKSDVAWATGKAKKAMSLLIAASRTCDQKVDTLQVIYDTGNLSIGMLIAAQEERMRTKLMLIRAEKVAQAAGVDVTVLTMPNFP